MYFRLFSLTILIFTALHLKASDDVFKDIDVFDLEWASQPQISPDGSQIVYLRNFMDIMKDRRRSNIWIINSDGTDHRPITEGMSNYASPRWSPDGKKLIYASGGQIHMRWMDTGQTAQLTQLTNSMGGLSWSPDGKWIAFTMFVPKKGKSLAKMPKKPKGAEWAKPAVVIDQLRYKADGNPGFLDDGYRHIFVLSADGGTPRQLTSGEFNYGGTPQWLPDSSALIISANLHDEWEYEPNNSEVHRLDLDGKLTTLTDRLGPDNNPKVSPDGKHIAYQGFDDRYQGYQISRLYVMDIDGSNSRRLLDKLDRSIENIAWTTDGKSIYVQYTDKANTHVATVPAKGGDHKVLTDRLGGTALGRPYGSGSFTASNDGVLTFIHSQPDRPADVGVYKDGKRTVITSLNEDLFGHKQLGEVEEIWYKSSYDQRDIQGWIVKPPNFDPNKKYPMVLEIHGGPFQDYGPHFTSEIQLFASAGYVGLYTNPRGSTSYGEEFGNLIHHNYPSQDFDDLMSGVDALIAKGYVDPDNLFVTGGSGGGVLTSWIISHTDRFRAAVVAKPVINWYSFVLTADSYNFFYKYWFPGFPWDHLEHYMQRSPIHHVGKVKTPTMMLTGEKDYRTPMSETEQFYQALKLLKVDTVMVRIPGAPHGITRRPSNLISKVNHIIAWFEKYRK